VAAGGCPGSGGFGGGGSLELCDSAKDAEGQQAARSGGVHRFRERAQLDAASVQVSVYRKQVGNGAVKSV